MVTSFEVPREHRKEETAHVFSIPRDFPDHMNYIESCMKYSDAQSSSPIQRSQVFPYDPDKPHPHWESYKREEQNMPRESIFPQLCFGFAFEELLGFRFIFPDSCMKFLFKRDILTHVYDNPGNNTSAHKEKLEPSTPLSLFCCSLPPILTDANRLVAIFATSVCDTHISIRHTDTQIQIFAIWFFNAFYYLYFAATFFFKQNNAL